MKVMVTIRGGGVVMEGAKTEAVARIGQRWQCEWYQWLPRVWLRTKEGGCRKLQNEDFYTRGDAGKLGIGSVQFQIWRESNRKPTLEFKTSSNGNSSEAGMEVESDNELNSNGIADGIRELSRGWIGMALILN